MLTAVRVIRRGERGGGRVLDTITLDRQSRYRRRVVIRTDGGHELLLDLPEATHLADGDGLLLDTGESIRVVAAPEPLMEIHAGDALSLARLAWHLGNRHTPAEITPHAIYIQPDHVLAEMVSQLGGHVHHVVRPFEPEGGAYGGHGPLDKGHHHHHHGDHDHGPGEHDDRKHHDL